MCVVLVCECVVVLVCGVWVCGGVSVRWYGGVSVWGVWGDRMRSPLFYIVGQPWTSICTSVSTC